MPTFSANGTSPEIVVNTQMDKAWLHASGTFGAGSLQWEFKGDDGLWHPLAAAVTADSNVEAPVGSGALIVRAVLTGATAPTIYYNAR